MLTGTGRRMLGGVPDGLEGQALARLLDNPPADTTGDPLIYIARDAGRIEAIQRSLAFFAPYIDTLVLPAWDCLAYDRVSPNIDVAARRAAALSRLVPQAAQALPPVLLTTANAVLQKFPDPQAIAGRSLTASAGGVFDRERLIDWLEKNGFARTPTVRDVGEYAVRGGIVDLYAPGTGTPLRLDFFGDTLESIRPFDPADQRTTGQMPTITLAPASEIAIDEGSIERFRHNYRAAFGAVTDEDALYAAISEGRRFAGMEHWLPFFHERLTDLLETFARSPVILDPLLPETIAERQARIADHYQARREALGQDSGGSSLSGASYKPIPPETLFIMESEWVTRLADRATVYFSPFAPTDSDSRNSHDLGGRTGRSFAAERAAGNINMFDVLATHIGELRERGRKVILAAWSEGAADRMAHVLADHGIEPVVPVTNFAGAGNLGPTATGLAVLPLESGFVTGELALIGDQYILGDRLVRSPSRRKRAADALTEAASLDAGDFVVHVEHGIARFAGLKTIEAAGAPHDCLELEYAGSDRLFLPVENIDLLTRYGGQGSEATLDRLGGAGWQSRKAKLKKRIRDIAEALIRTAAARLLDVAPKFTAPAGLYDEFSARFPYEETEDQNTAIEAVLEDLATGRPMDRLVCGDVGFGKTEVALRAAFVTAMEGKQVAIVVPTTLLARQHYETFLERFRGLPINVKQASRLVGSGKLAAIKSGLTDGTVDIVIGTHALLGKSIKFRDLGLLIVDEEQHFGVRHKEQLKAMKGGIHVLTLTATPIPRTLQMALTGVRDLSLITTPPVDRMAVRTFITPFDTLAVREALIRERVRGGQSFYVVPRISDLAQVRDFLDTHVPECKVAVAHGQMPPGQLDETMTAFYDGQYDILLSTTIIESGLDIPTANTLIVHRSHMFGLSQLYQLRGRIGRSKLRAWALMTVPANLKLTSSAERRLKVLQSLETLGAGFQLASHDLDIRGAGNLLGEEQSGHIREVGFELYQHMLEEAVASLKTGDGEAEAEDHWSPQITIGMPVLIPEGFVADLPVRMSLYRRLATLIEAEEIDAFGAELIDRFGSLPQEVEHLLKIVLVKGLCRKANVEKIEAGPKGVVVTLRGNTFANPAGLIAYIGEPGSMAKMRPDQRIMFARNWPDGEARLRGVATILARLVQLAEAAEQAAA
ncbi:MAG: transcription-repair coupling factor [Alphaproteobacteria bacterium]